MSRGGPTAIPNRTLTAGPAAPPVGPWMGVAFMLAALVLLPVMDALAKGLQERLPLAQVVWARYAFHLLILLPVVAVRHGRAAIVPKRAWMQLARSSVLLVTTIAFFASIGTLPLADALALFFVSPLIVTLLAAWWLRERVGIARAIAVIVGFVGVLAILRPGIAVVSPAALLALLAGTAHAVYMVITRRLAGTAPPVVTLAYTAVVGTVVTTAWVLPRWQPIAGIDLAWMLAIGVLAAAGHMLIIRAFEAAPAAWLAPLGYAEIVVAVAIGFVAFGNLPDAWTWLGIVTLVASGLVITLADPPSRR